MGGDNSHKYTFPRKFLSRLNPFHDHRYRQNTTIFSIHFYILDTFWSWQREWPSPCTARFMPRANPIGPACTLGETATTTLSHIHMRDRIKGNTYVSPVPSFSLSLSLFLSPRYVIEIFRTMPEDHGSRFLLGKKERKKYANVYEPSNENMAMWRLRGRREYLALQKGKKGNK